MDFCWLKIKFVELDFYNLIFEKSSTDQLGVRVLYFTVWVYVHILKIYFCDNMVSFQKILIQWGNKAMNEDSCISLWPHPKRSFKIYFLGQLVCVGGFSCLQFLNGMYILYYGAWKAILIWYSWEKFDPFHTTSTLDCFICTSFIFSKSKQNCIWTHDNLLLNTKVSQLQLC